MVHKILQNPKTKRFTVFKQVPEKVGQFGEWKIVAGGLESKSQAVAKIKELNEELNLGERIGA